MMTPAKASEGRRLLDAAMAPKNVWSDQDLRYWLWDNRDELVRLAELGADHPGANAERDGEWVSCEELLPEPDRNVLVSENGGEPYKAYRDGADWFALDSAFPRRFVTHWMPLPAPPQPKGAK